MTVSSRTALLLVGAAAASVTLAGCSKPTPRVLIKAGSSSVSSEAVSYCRDGSCQRYDNDVQHIAVRYGDTVGIDVPRDVADNGWSAVLYDPNAAAGDSNANPLFSVKDSHYQTFQVAADFAHPVQLQVFETGTADQPKGAWTFELVPRSTAH